MPLKLSNYRFKSSEIKHFLNNSLQIRTSVIKIYYSDEFPSQKFAVIAPKYIGNAVVRNKCRRWLRNILLGIIPFLTKKYSIILMATKNCSNSNFKNCHNMVLLKLTKKKILHENN